MRPTLTLLEPELVGRVLGEAFELLMEPGVRVHEPEATALLAAAGADVRDGTARIPERVVRDALATVPRAFALYDRAGIPAVRYGEGAVQFDPGSCGVHVLDPDTLEHRPSMAADLVRIVQVTDGLDAYAASIIAVSIAPIGVVPTRMSRIAGAPPQTIGAPGRASWWMAIPERHSAACWTTLPMSVTGAAAPASGIDTICAGTPARARSMRLRHPSADHVSGGDGQTSKTARGLAARAS
jgi:hypothetical protein